MKIAEALVFSMIAAAALLWLLGMPFELGFDDSLGYSLIGLLFIFPALGNFVILLAGSEENGGERICAGVRGVGMVICGG